MLLLNGMEHTAWLHKRERDRERKLEILQKNSKLYIKKRAMHKGIIYLDIFI
jgi:hypothetical protein